MRMDLPFGVTFFLFRILWHITVEVLLIRTGTRGQARYYAALPASFLGLALNAGWFYKWIQQQQRIRLKRKAEKDR